MSEKKYIDNNRNFRSYHLNILEVIFILYCLIFFKDYLNNDIKILNYKLEKNAINNILLNNEVKNSIQKKNINIISKLNFDEENNNIKVKNKKCITNLIHFITLSYVFVKFNIINKINITSTYIVDVICCIVYCIYSKSRKKINYDLISKNSNNKYNSLCVI